MSGGGEHTISTVCGSQLAQTAQLLQQAVSVITDFQADGCKWRKVASSLSSGSRCIRGCPGWLRCFCDCLRICVQCSQAVTRSRVQRLLGELTKKYGLAVVALAVASLKQQDLDSLCKSGFECFSETLEAACGLQVCNLLSFSKECERRSKSDSFDCLDGLALGWNFCDCNDPNDLLSMICKADLVCNTLLRTASNNSLSSS